MASPTANILVEVASERARQDAKWGEQNHPDGTGETLFDLIDADAARERCNAAAKDGSITWRHILEEEVAEAFAEADPDKLRDELLQVAAVACSWVEALDRRTGCRKCGASFDLPGHHKTRTGGWCRKCASDYERLRRDANKDMLNARSRERYDPARRREQTLRYNYGPTTADYAAMLAAQGGGCAICGAMSGDATGRPLSVDHCHATDRVRGLLCAQCNNGLGRFSDEPGRLIRAAEYLRQWIEALDRRTKGGG